MRGEQAAPTLRPMAAFRAEPAHEKKKGPRGPRNSLIRLDSAKEIKGNPSPCISVRGGSWLFARAQFELVNQ
jgi:hypothetical protein